MISYTKNKPLIVIPCSADKANEACQAINLYKGKGYIPILKSSTAALWLDYNLAFMSAKYGLVMADTVLKPYDQTLSEKSIDALIKCSKSKAKRIMGNVHPNRIVACLPKLYLRAFTQITEDFLHGISVTTPPPGAGIGSQRGFLSNELMRCEPTSFDVFVFERTHQRPGRTPEKPPKTALLKVSLGDVVEPWISGVGNDKHISNPVTVTKIINRRFGTVFLDEHGKAWHANSVKMGLCEETKSYIASFGGHYACVDNKNEITVSWRDIPLINKFQAT